MNVNLRVKFVRGCVESVREFIGIDPKFSEEILARKGIVWSVFF